MRFIQCIVYKKFDFSRKLTFYFHSGLVAALPDLQQGAASAPLAADEDVYIVLYEYTARVITKTYYALDYLQ